MLNTYTDILSFSSVFHRKSMTIESQLFSRWGWIKERQRENNILEKGTGSHDDNGKNKKTCETMKNPLREFF